MSENSQNNKPRGGSYHPVISKISFFISKLFYTKGNAPTPQGQEKTHHWFSVLCLTGVDYFSTLAYQPGIALLAVGLLAPFSTLLLVIVTLLGAVPVYREVASRSYTGQGSIAMLEKLLSGWPSKISVLALIAFAMTDFFITMTLSASDAAAHIIENPIFSTYVGHSPLSVSLVLISLLGIVFYIGFKEAIAVALFSTIPFLLLTFVVLSASFFEIYKDISLLYNWVNSPVFSVDWTGLFIISAVAFPKLALGLSGFETGVSVMPLIHNGEGKNVVEHPPIKRIEGTKKLLITSAVIMSIYLILSSIVTSILVKQTLVQDGAEASGRALSYLAHKFLGNIYGTVYDVSTIFILWFAGASAMAGLLSVIPRYLPRFGMAPIWLERRRPMVFLVTAINVLLLIIFDANVNAQAGAYATGVLALILSASVAVALSLSKESHVLNDSKLKYKSYYFWFVSLIFAFTLLDNMISRPDGLIIAMIFFCVIVFASAISRWSRAFELRVESHKLIDDESIALMSAITDKKVNLVPISGTDKNWFKRKEAKIRKYYKCNDPIAFLVINLRDDRSEFVTPLEIKIGKMESNSENYIITVKGAVAIPNTIAYISEQIDPIAIYLGLARKNAMEQAIFYVLFGEGEVGILTYKVLVQYWESTPEDDVRPVLFLMSE